MGHLAAVMGSGPPMEWDEWDCDCGGQGPPFFDLPPPPPPPDLMEKMLGVAPSPSPGSRAPLSPAPLLDCPVLWSCPALLGARGEPAPPESKLPVAVVIATAISLVLLVIVVAAVVYRLRVNRSRSAKNCTELNGGIIYEDLPSAPTLIITPRGRPPRYKPPSVHHHHHHHQLRHQLADRSLHVYTPEPHQLAGPGHHRYHSISSGGTETCSCSISETPSCALLPHGPSPDTSSAPRPLLSSDDDTPTPSPYHYYAPRRPSNSTLYESLYYTGSASSSRSSNSQPRALPPLPSRSDRFRIYFSNDRRGGASSSGSGGRRQPQQHHPLQGVTLVPPPPPEIEPLYENI